MLYSCDLDRLHLPFSAGFLSKIIGTHVVNLFILLKLNCYKERGTVLKSSTDRCWVVLGAFYHEKSWCYFQNGLFKLFCPPIRIFLQVFLFFMTYSWSFWNRSSVIVLVMLELLHAHPITNGKTATKELSNKQIKLSIFLFYRRFKTQYNMSGKKSRRIKENNDESKNACCFSVGGYEKGNHQEVWNSGVSWTTSKINSISPRAPEF